MRCLQCSKPIPQSRTKPRRFCSGRCRTKYGRLKKTFLRETQAPAPEHTLSSVTGVSDVLAYRTDASMGGTHD